jgi:RNase P/RNase MRP subunit p29
MATANRHLSLVAVVLLAGCGGGGEISGTVTGLTASGLSLSNGFETIDVAKDATRFAFPTEVEDGNGYAVVVVTQPTGLRCTVSNGSGSVSGGLAPPAATVNCVAAWSISGRVNGLSRSGLVLANGSEDITIAANAASFAFATQLPGGASYSVTVRTQPALQRCTVGNGDGVVGQEAVSDVLVSCF